MIASTHLADAGTSSGGWASYLVSAITLGLIPLAIWWFRRHDQVAVQIRDMVSLVDDMRMDLQDMREWGFLVRNRWNTQQDSLLKLGIIQEIAPLPPMPELRVSQHSGARDVPSWFQTYKVKQD